MILQSLYQLYDRLENDASYGMPTVGYSVQKISFRIVLYPDGSIFEIQPIPRTESGMVQMQVPGQTKPSGPGIHDSIAYCFLWDNTQYMLGYKAEDPNPQRSHSCFEAFRDKHLAVEKDITSDAFSAVCRFLEQWNPAYAEQYKNILDDVVSGFGVFQLIGLQAYVHQDTRVQHWWEQQNNNQNDQSLRGQCLLTGEENVPITRLQPKIRGIPGGNPDKSLVGFKPDAFKSYGKDQAYNAPVSKDAARRYGAALNALLEGPKNFKHRFSLGETTVVFWTERPTITEDVFAQYAVYGSSTENQDENNQDPTLLNKLSAFLGALRQGREEYDELADDDPGKTRFFILGLSPNSARVCVRFFNKTTIKDLLHNLRRHHADCGVERQYDENAKKPDPRMPPFSLLLSQTARTKKEIPPLLEGPLMRAVITGIQYPPGLVAAVIRRIRADRRITYPRAFIIKGFLTRNLNQEVPMSLDKTRTDAAYRLGRLFAALERTQADALGKVNASIRDRFYSAASATPRSVFPRLMRTYQHHLANLDEGKKVNREKLMQEIMEPLQDFPASFSLAQQGVFAIGYYHQNNDFFTKNKNENE